MAISGWLQPLVWPLLIAAFVAISALRRRATLLGVAVLAAVCFGLFALWQGLAILGIVAALELAGVFIEPWPQVAIYLAVTAVLMALGVAIGWGIRGRVLGDWT